MCLKYWDVNNIYGWVMSQKLPVNELKGIEDLSEFNEDFIKRYKDILNLQLNIHKLHIFKLEVIYLQVNEGYFFRLIFNILKIYMNSIMIYRLCLY